MLIHKNNRFYAGKSSFALPDGCQVNDAPLATFANGINLKTGDGTCMVDVNFEFGLGGAQRSLEDSLILGDFINTKVKQRTYAGQVGWCAEYRGELYSYFEVRFDAETGLTDGNGMEVNIFRVVVTAPRDADLKTVRHSPVIIGILDSFQP